MDDIDYQAFKGKIGELTVQNKQLQKANLNMKREVKQLRRIIKKLKDDVEKQKKKQKMRR